MHADFVTYYHHLSIYSCWSLTEIVLHHYFISERLHCYSLEVLMQIGAVGVWLVKSKGNGLVCAHNGVDETQRIIMFVYLVVIKIKSRIGAVELDIGCDLSTSRPNAWIAILVAVTEARQHSLQIQVVWSHEVSYIQPYARSALKALGEYLKIVPRYETLRVGIHLHVQIKLGLHQIALCYFHSAESQFRPDRDFDNFL